MITEDYVSFEVAKLLKEKGFDGDCGDCECHMFYHEMTDRIMPIMEIGLVPDYDDVYFAPTHQMAMKWLREEYDIFIDIGYDDLDFYWLIESIANDVPVQDRPKLLKNGTACHRTYEEAVESALKYTLENLI